MPPNASAKGPTNGMVPPTPMYTGSTPKPARSARSVASNAQPRGSQCHAGTASSSVIGVLEAERDPTFEVRTQRGVEPSRILPAADAHADARRGLGDDLVRRSCDRVSVDADDGDGRAQPDALEDRRRRIARELHAVAQSPRAPEAGLGRRERGEPGALVGVGWLVVVPAAVERGVAVLVDQRGEQLREREHRVGDGPARHPAVDRAVEGADPHVDAREPAQGVGEAGRAHRPVAGVGEEQHVGRAARRRGSSRNAPRVGEPISSSPSTSTFTLHGSSPAVRIHARTAATCATAPALSSAVPRPKSRPSRSRRFERIRRPPVDVAGRLHVVVRVEEHGGRVGTLGPLADDVGEPAVGAQLAHVVQPRVAHELGDGRRATCRRRRCGRDRR